MLEIVGLDSRHLCGDGFLSPSRQPGAVPNSGRRRSIRKNRTGQRCRHRAYDDPTDGFWRSESDSLGARRASVMRRASSRADADSRRSFRHDALPPPNRPRRRSAFFRCGPWVATRRTRSGPASPVFGMRIGAAPERSRDEAVSPEGADRDRLGRGEFRRPGPAAVPYIAAARHREITRCGGRALHRNADCSGTRAAVEHGLW